MLFSSAASKLILFRKSSPEEEHTVQMVLFGLFGTVVSFQHHEVVSALSLALQIEKVLGSISRSLECTGIGYMLKVGF